MKLNALKMPLSEFAALAVIGSGGGIGLDGLHNIRAGFSTAVAAERARMVCRDNPLDAACPPSKLMNLKDIFDNALFRGKFGASEFMGGMVMAAVGGFIGIRGKKPAAAP